MVETSHTAGLWPALMDPLRTVGARIADWFAPASEAAAEEDAYEVRIELPGVPRDAVDIALADRVLTIRGEKSAERSGTAGSVYFCERQYGAFQRSFRLPHDAAEDGLDAALADGVLTIRIPKRSPKPDEARRIAIRGG